MDQREFNDAILFNKFDFTAYAIHSNTNSTSMYCTCRDEWVSRLMSTGCVYYVTLACWHTPTHFFAHCISFTPDTRQTLTADFKFRLILVSSQAFPVYTHHVKNNQIMMFLCFWTTGWVAVNSFLLQQKYPLTEVRYPAWFLQMEPAYAKSRNYNHTSKAIIGWGRPTIILLKAFQERTEGLHTGNIPLLSRVLFLTSY